MIHLYDQERIGTFQPNPLYSYNVTLHSPGFYVPDDYNSEIIYDGVVSFEINLVHAIDGQPLFSTELIASVICGRMIQIEELPTDQEHRDKIIERFKRLNFQHTIDYYKLRDHLFTLL